MWLILMDGLQKRCSKIDVPFFFFLPEFNCALKVLCFFVFFQELNSKFYQVGMHFITKRTTKLLCLQFWIFVYGIFFKQGHACILGSSLKCQKYTVTHVYLPYQISFLEFVAIIKKGSNHSKCSSFQGLGQSIFCITYSFLLFSINYLINVIN